MPKQFDNLVKMLKEDLQKTNVSYRADISNTIIQTVAKFNAQLTKVKEDGYERAYNRWKRSTEVDFKELITKVAHCNTYVYQLNNNKITVLQ